MPVTLSLPWSRDAPNIEDLDGLAVVRDSFESIAPMFTLETFGGLTLRGDHGPVTGRASQRRRLTLLAVLAAERRAVSRDKLLGLLWSETDAERARHLLADSLYVLRAGLCEDAVLTSGDDVSLNEERVASDVAAFAKAIDDGQLERAVGMYSGPFLDGIFISDAPEFERWTESTRTQLADAHRRCLERLASEAGARGNHVQAAEWWRSLANADPLSSRVATGLIRALSLAGDRAAALQFARVHEDIVRAQLDAKPDPAVVALVAELRAARDDGAVVVHASTPAPARSDRPATVRDESVLQAFGPPPVARLTTARPWRPRPASMAIAIVLAGALTAGLVIARGGTTTRPRVIAPDPVAADTRPTIAVLPFEAIGTDRETDYIAEGVTDVLTTALDRLQKLRVVSFTSAYAAKRSGLATPAIGEMLQVRHLVEGSVRLAARQMRISARLLDATNGTVLWSEEFVREFAPTPVIAVEETIARSIASTLNVRLTEGSAAQLAGRAPANAAAFDAYLLGRHFWATRNPDGIRKSIGYFEQSIEKDSTFAPAYSGLADAYSAFAIGNMGDFRADDYFPLARRAAEHALALDSTLAEAHASLGYFHLLNNLDWQKAEAEISKAIDLRPSYPVAHLYRATLLEWTGRFPEAVAEARLALSVDRLTPAPNIELGRALFFARQYDEAERQLRLTLDLDSMSFRAHLTLGQVLLQQGRTDDAIRELSRATHMANSSRPLALLAHAYAWSGNRREATRLLDSLHMRARLGYVPAFDFAIVHAGLKEPAQAADWLARSVQDHSIRPFLMDATFDGVRRDARVRALLTRLGIPETDIALITLPPR